MCGIVGFCSLGRERVSRKKLLNAVNIIKHRGPNHQAANIYDEGKYGLGHARLSIIDLSNHANQPMRRGDCSVIFNGEIYNYIELRKELIEKGYEFSTHSDTETLLCAYDYWGEDCVRHFNGMWAFAILNHKTKTLFCSRDRFGVKPFNYSLNKDRFIFSSEIKSLLLLDSKLAKPNYNSIALFAREGLSAELEDTWFEGVKRLAPGENIIIAESFVKKWRWYEFPSNTNQSLNMEDAKKKFHEIFENAVKIRLRSDVPIGTTLSGGLDSSAIAGAIHSVHNGIADAYTATFSFFRNDEGDQARKTAELFGLNEIFVNCDYDSKTYLSILKKIVWHLESGHASTSIFPLWKIYESAQKRLTVLLEGQGADECLAGYIDGAVAFEFLQYCLLSGKFSLAKKEFLALKKNYSIRRMAIMYLRTKLPTFLRTFGRKFYLKTEDLFKDRKCVLKEFKYPKNESRKYSKNSFIAALQHSHAYGLTSLLHYGDAISMAHSMENRLPFMDYRLVDFAFTLPPEFFLKNGLGKVILRESLEDYLPHALKSNPSKKGFPSPISDFLDKEREIIRKLLLSPEAIKRNLYNKNELDRVLMLTGKAWEKAHRTVFRLLCIELWFELFIDPQKK